MSENSYLRNITAHVSQIVFLASLTVLRLITTVGPETTQNSYLRHVNANVSQIVFLAYSTALKAYYNSMNLNLRKHVSPRFQCKSITNRVLSLFDRFAA